MKCRAGSLWLHCVLLSLLSLLATNVAADATLYGLDPAFEGQFLTEAFQQTSIAVGSDGVITVVDLSATDGIIAHGTYGVTLLESSNGLEFHASGPLYSEYMSCALDTRASIASCVFTESITTSTIVGTFTPSRLPVVAIIPTQSSTSSSTIPLQTSASPSSGGGSGGSSSSPSSGGSGLSTGALAGIIVAIVVVVLILIIALVLLVITRRRRMRAQQNMARDIEQFDARPPPSFPMSPTEPGSEGAVPSTGVYPSSQSFTDATSSSSPLSEKRRMMFFAANAEQPPQSPPPPSTVADTVSLAQSQPGGENVDTRQILEEMRRMREEVAHLRTEANVVPPEYSES